MFNINQFAANGLIEGGARPTQFKVDIFLPFASQQESRFQLLCFATSLPGMQIGQVPVHYFGRMIKLAGDRNIDDWSVAIYNDANFGARSVLEKWSNDINTLISNRLNPDMYATQYKATAEVTQLGMDGRTLRAYRFDGIWPAEVSPIRLSWQDQNQIEMFECRFSVDWFEPVDQSSSTDTYNPFLPDDGAISGNPSDL